MKKILFEPQVSVMRFDKKDIIATSFGSTTDEVGADGPEGYEGGFAPGRAPLGSDMWTL